MEADRIPIVEIKYVIYSTIYNAGVLAGWNDVGGYLTEDQGFDILGNDKLMTYDIQEELRYVYTIT